MKGVVAEVTDEEILEAKALIGRYGFGCDADPGELLEDPTLQKLGFDAAFLATLDERAPGLFEVARTIAA
mgnify:CR=1 FL=1